MPSTDSEGVGIKRLDSKSSQYTIEHAHPIRYNDSSHGFDRLHHNGGQETPPTDCCCEIAETVGNALSVSAKAFASRHGFLHVEGSAPDCLDLLEQKTHIGRKREHKPANARNVGSKVPAVFLEKHFRTSAFTELEPTASPNSLQTDGMRLAIFPRRLSWND